MQSPHPLPHTDPFDGTAKSSVRRRHEQLLPASAPSSAGSEVSGTEGVTDGQRGGRAPAEPEPARRSQWEGRPILHQVSRTHCAGEDVDVAHLGSGLTGSCSVWCVRSELLADAMLSCGAGGWMRTEATERAFPNPARVLEPGPRRPAGLGGRWSSCKDHPTCSLLAGGLSGDAQVKHPSRNPVSRSQEGAPPLMHTRHTRSHAPAELPRPLYPCYLCIKRPGPCPRSV